MNAERRIALLVFHKDWGACAARIRLLRAMNPGVLVHGLFGGEAADFLEVQQRLGPDLDGLLPFHEHDGHWRWQNTDLMVRSWFGAAGHRIPFDIVHVVQWDLLLLDSLENLYRGVAPRALGLTGLTPVERIADRWHWTRTEPAREEWAELLSIARSRHGYCGEPLACLGPGYSLPRAFLERYSVEEIPALGHDELRLPLFAQLFGFELFDTGFYPAWFDPEGERLFNANGDEIALEDVLQSVEAPAGRRAFHPCRESFREPEIELLLSRSGRQE